MNIIFKKVEKNEYDAFRKDVNYMEGNRGKISRN